jgi:hypothetical protein
MLKRKINLGVLLLIVFISGCSFDVVDLFLNDAQIQKFTEQYPNADVTVVHFDPGEVDLEQFKEICNKELNSDKEIFRAEINDPDSGLKIIAFLDATTQQMECVRKYGLGEAPVLKEKTSPPSLSDGASARTAPQPDEPTTTHPTPPATPQEGIEAPVEGVIRDSESQLVRPTEPMEDITCTEYDDGEIHVSGRSIYTINGEEFYEDDICDGDTLKESHCLSSSQVPINQDVECEFGCREGACIEVAVDAATNTPVSPTADTCFASDGGYDEYDAGTISGIKNGINYESSDYCVTNMKLMEHYCIEDLSTSQEADCPFGCLYGECLPEIDDNTPEPNPTPITPEQEQEDTTTFTKNNPESCTDSDGGINSDLKGTTKIFYTGGSTTYQDSCWGQSVKEYYCENNQAVFEQVFCTNACVNGACSDS